MSNLSRVERNELTQIRNSRAVRIAVYDAAILIGAFLLAEEIGSGRISWPIPVDMSDLFSKTWFEYAFRLIALTMWVSAIMYRYRDWKSIKFIEGLLERDGSDRLA